MATTGLCDPGVNGLTAQAQFIRDVDLSSLPGENLLDRGATNLKRDLSEALVTIHRVSGVWRWGELQMIGGDVRAVQAKL